MLTASGGMDGGDGRVQGGAELGLAVGEIRFMFNIGISLGACLLHHERAGLGVVV